MTILSLVISTDNDWTGDQAEFTGSLSTNPEHALLIIVSIPIKLREEGRGEFYMWRRLSTLQRNSFRH